MGEVDPEDVVDDKAAEKEGGDFEGRQANYGYECYAEAKADYLNFFGSFRRWFNWDLYRKKI